MKQLTFIHAADLHLDSPFKGLTHLPTSLFEEVRQSTFYAFDDLINNAVTYEVDFVLLVGDLFDHEEQSLKAQIRLRDGFSKLQAHDIQVYLSYGNHDFLQQGGQKILFPENVSVFESETVQSFFYKKNGELLAEIHGFSYERRAVTASKIIDYPVNSQDDIFHIGMLHGAINGNSDHHTYAPFRMEELKGKGYNYWALGHIHQRTMLQESPPIVYSGNTQGRHRKETGEKGCYLVHMTMGQTSLTFLPLQHIQFADVTLNIETLEHIDDVEKLLTEQIAVMTDGPYLVTVTWDNVGPNQFGRQTEHYLNELIEVSNEQTSQATPWLYIYRSTLSFAPVQEQKVNGLFMEEVERAFLTIDIIEEISELTTHTQARKFLELPTDEDMLAEAQSLLKRKLMQNEDG